MRFAALAIVLTLAVSPLAAPPAAAQAPTPLFVFIYRQGPTWKAGTPMTAQPGIGRHGAYMKQLFDEGRTFAAGPMTDQAGGLLILRAASQDEAAAILAKDPAITSGLFLGEVHGWAPAFRSDQPLPKTP